MNKFFLVLLLCGSLLLPASASDFNLNFTNSSVTITHDNSTFTYITGIYYQTTMSIPNDIYVNNITNNSCSVDIDSITNSVITGLGFLNSVEQCQSTNINLTVDIASKVNEVQLCQKDIVAFNDKLLMANTKILELKDDMSTFIWAYLIVLLACVLGFYGGGLLRKKNIQMVDE